MKAEAKHAKAILDDLQAQKEKAEKQEIILRESVLKCLNTQLGVTEILGKPMARSDRIEFEYLHIHFFVAYRFLFDSIDDDPVLRLSVEYGVTRHKGDPFIKDKSLRAYSVNESGLIRDPGGLSGAWFVDEKRVKENEKLDEVHYLILRDMFSDALDWSNSYPAMDRK